MARLITAGAELQALDGTAGSTAGIDGASVVSGAGNTLTYDTTVKRSGAASYKCVTGATGGFAEIGFPFTVAQGTPCFCRGYALVPSAVGWPAGGGIIVNVARSTTAFVEVRVSSTGVATLWASNVQVGSGSYQLALDTWHRIEVKFMIPAAGNGTLALQIDGSVVVADTSVNLATSVASVSALWGANGANGVAITNFTVYIDDVAVNDSTGAAQNSYPGAGSVVILKPASDNARTNWTTDSAGTTNLWDAVNNEPPVGIADTTVGSGLHQVRNSVSAIANYDSNLQAYSVAGVPIGSTVTLVQAVASMSAASTTSIPVQGLQLLSNAGGTAETIVTAYSPAISAAAGTWPTNWVSEKNPTVVMAAQPTLTSAPVLRLQKATASTRIAMCCFMGLIVEYVPPPLLAGQARGRHLAARSSSPARGRF